jgi:phosphomevalonate decarboxylase
MKATAQAHPIQGLIKYHGLRNSEYNIPYHDSISVCTAPSKTRTTVEFGYRSDSCLVNGAEIDSEGYERTTTVLNRIRSLAGIDTSARVVSENTFESNVGLGASASAFAALTLAAATAAKLELSRKELSAVARRGATSAARSITGGFSHLRSDRYDGSCVAEPIANSFDEEIRIVVGLVSQYKQTSRAHRETPHSHLFGGRLAYIHGALTEMREAIQNGTARLRLN